MWAMDPKEKTEVQIAESEVAVAENPPTSELADAAVYAIATLEDLLLMTTAAEPPVGVALHIQAASWHNSLPAISAANTTFEDILLGLLQKHGYATAPYGTEAWRSRPLYIMAFEAGSLRYLANQTSAPLTQVLG
ncbi:hypothetical protein GPECTOR_14g140 [Gonium pectorale]|uniref:Uncharacterized protein n=1 Tax=Gonium pectorale TaxID=33097 RepID=A0A150GM94_GONPE|nr:hypothetical protein GPECTOR_14g140 [Gonium pectorale]|eukprot:KXZ50892.1 hypothetical protein GPECTOR_14g140 [Gonium pectorale]